MYISPTYGRLTLEQISQIIVKEIILHPDDKFEILVGSDSQNTYFTKMVTVIAVHNVGHGGFYFYHISKYNKIKDLRTKLWIETQLSVSCVDDLIKCFEDTDFDYTQIHFSIHVDAGENGPSGKVIPELLGYIRSHGFEANYKPNSPVASGIADRISK